MVDVYRDQSGQQSWREDDGGIQATTTYLLDNVAQTSAGICNAQAALGLPDLGDNHPCFNDLVLREINGRDVPGDPSKWRIDYVYRALESENTPGGQFSMAGSFVSNRTTRDRLNNLIVATYTYPVLYKDVLLAGKTNNQVIAVDVEEPTLLLRWSRLQSTFTPAWNNTRNAFAHVNLNVWHGFAAESVYCTRAEIEQANQKWREIFEFQWKASGWKAYGIFLQEDDNRPVPDPTPSSEVHPDVIPTFDFATLGLELPS